MAILLGVFFIISLGYSAKTRFVPLIIVTPTLVIALGRVVAGIFVLVKARFTIGNEATSVTSESPGLVGEAILDRMTTQKLGHDAFHVDTSKLPGMESAGSADRWRKELVAVAWILLLLVLVFLIGLLWTIPIFIFLSLRVRSREKWRLSIILSLGAWAFMYVLFFYVLKIQFDNGYLINLFLG